MLMPLFNNQINQNNKNMKISLLLSVFVLYISWAQANSQTNSDFPLGATNSSCSVQNCIRCDTEPNTVCDRCDGSFVFNSPSC